MKPGMIVRIMTTSYRAKSWVGQCGVSTSTTDDLGHIVIRMIRSNSALTHYTLWVEPQCLEII